MNNIEITNIISEIKNKLVKESNQTLFEIYSYNGLGLNELYSVDQFDSDSIKERASINIRNKIKMEKPKFIISVCIGLMKPVAFSNKKKDKRDVLIICIETEEGLYHIENLFINRRGSKINGFSVAWKYNNKTIKEHNFSISGILCDWYKDLDDIKSVF